MNPLIRNILIGFAAFCAIVVLGIAGWVAFAVQGLPNYEQLAEYEPPITTRVHAGDGSLIAEFATEHRIFVPAEAIPDTVKNAFLSAEDQNFFEHGGLDWTGIARATLVNIASIFTGDRMQGASTITQQVAKNMLLTSDRTITRKVKEAFLARRIERAFTKDRILELYLNEIYLGQRAYGVAAAALNYFNKPLSELTVAEAAYLAALPKAPNNYHPVRQKERAIARRNWVIGQMVANGYITEEEAKAAQAEDLRATDRLAGEQYVMSAHFVEELRRQALRVFGEDKLYEGGLSIRSTLDTELQVAAARALRTGLEGYDRRRGWRGPIDKGLDLDGDVAARLRDLPAPPGASGWLRAVVTKADARTVEIRTEEGGEGRLLNEDVAWAAQGARRNRDRALSPGAAIYVARSRENRFALKQVPEVEGAIVAMDANTGRVKAMVGGYTFGRSEYNRVTQARRQPGSAFKPIVYAAALEYGLTPATLIEDGPFSLAAGDGSTWSPENYTREFFGPTTLRQGLEKSRNPMTVRLAYEMGMERVSEYANRLGAYDKLDPFPAMALGAGETTLMRLVGAYTTFVNGGKRVQPTLVDRIQDRYGRTIYRHDQRVCAGCADRWNGQPAPVLPDDRVQILDPIVAYQVTSILQGAVERGTGGAARVSGHAIAGKTGTTNDYKDAWFIGFSPDLVVGVWIGFDSPRDMGEGETGGRLAAPVFRQFMEAALKDEPASLFRRPPGLRIVRIDAKTGALPGPETTEVIDENFRPDTEPVSIFVASADVVGDDLQVDPSMFEDLGSVFPDENGAAVAQAPQAARPSPSGAQPPQSTRPDDPLGGIY